MVEFEHQGRGSKGWVIRDNAVHGTGQCCGVWWDTLGCFASMVGQERVGLHYLNPVLLSGLVTKRRFWWKAAGST